MSKNEIEDKEWSLFLEELFCLLKNIKYKKVKKKVYILYLKYPEKSANIVLNLETRWYYIQDYDKFYSLNLKERMNFLEFLKKRIIEGENKEEKINYGTYWDNVPF